MKRILLSFLFLVSAAFGQGVVGTGGALGRSGTLGGASGTTFTKAQFMGSNTQCASTSATCNFSPTSSTTIGNVSMVMVFAAANVTLSSISGGGATWVSYSTSGTGCANFYAGSSTYISCGYTSTAYTSSVASLTITLSAAPGAGNPFIVIYAEYSTTGAAPSFDTAGAQTQSSAVSPVPGVTLTPSGPSSVIIQCMGYGSTTGITGGSPAYGNFTQPGGGELACADSENTSSGTAPNWTVGTPQVANLNALALK